MSALIASLSQYLGMQAGTLTKLIISLTVVVVLLVIQRLSIFVLRRKIRETGRIYRMRRAIIYSTTALMIVLIVMTWIEGILGSLAMFLGLASAGIAVAMHDTIANIAGWFFIILRKPFRIGDRVQIGDTAGDVVDVRLLQFSLVEIGNWVDADQSTGRIIHIPNSKVLREPLANYQTGFEYIWHEIPVLITFESNWKKAKQLLNTIATEKAEHLAQGARTQIYHASMEYMIYFTTLTPGVFLSVRDSGVLLTIRYIVKPKLRRGTEDEIWEAVLSAFAEQDDIDLAYPTTRFYNSTPETPSRTIPEGTH